LGEERGLVDPPRARGGGMRLGEVLAPGDDLHAEGLADRADLGAELAEAEQAERLALEAGADRRLPLALAPSAILARDVAGEGEDETPGQLGRRIGQHVGAADGDPA